MQEMQLAEGCSDGDCAQEDGSLPNDAVATESDADFEE